MEDKTMEQQTYTPVEAIEITRNILNSIAVPMAYRKTIADPIEAALNNLAVIKDALTAKPTPEETEAD
jgi:hypothetical protein